VKTSKTKFSVLGTDHLLREVIGSEHNGRAVTEAYGGQPGLMSINRFGAGSTADSGEEFGRSC